MRLLLLTLSLLTFQVMMMFLAELCSHLPNHRRRLDMLSLLATSSPVFPPHRSTADQCLPQFLVNRQHHLEQVQIRLVCSRNLSKGKF